MSCVLYSRCEELFFRWLPRGKTDALLSSRISCGNRRLIIPCQGNTVLFEALVSSGGLDSPRDALQREMRYSSSVWYGSVMEPAAIKQSHEIE